MEVNNIQHCTWSQAHEPDVLVLCVTVWWQVTSQLQNVSCCFQHPVCAFAMISADDFELPVSWLSWVAMCLIFSDGALANNKTFFYWWPNNLSVSLLFLVPTFYLLILFPVTLTSSYLSAHHHSLWTTPARQLIQYETAIQCLGHLSKIQNCHLHFSNNLPSLLLLPELSTALKDILGLFSPRPTGYNGNQWMILGHSRVSWIYLCT